MGCWCLIPHPLSALSQTFPLNRLPFSPSRKARVSSCNKFSGYRIVENTWTEVNVSRKWTLIDDIDKSQCYFFLSLQKDHEFSPTNIHFESLTLNPSPTAILNILCKQFLHANVSAILYMMNYEQYGRSTASAQYFLQVMINHSS